jgi:hypothetical protein
LALAYCAGAALYSAVITALKFGTESPPLPWVARLVDWWTNTWPVVPTLAALLVLDRRASYRLVAWYILAGSLTVAAFTLIGQLLRGSLNLAPLTNVYWMIVDLVLTASLPLILLLITGWRRVRAVTPLALAVTLLFGFGAMFSREALTRALNVEAVRSAILDLAVLTSSEISYYAIFMLVSLPVGWLAWWLLRGLAHAFERKRFSDVQLIVDCWWVVVTAQQIGDAVDRSWAWWNRRRRGGVCGVPGRSLARTVASRTSPGSAGQASPPPAGLRL